MTLKRLLVLLTLILSTPTPSLVAQTATAQPQAQAEQEKEEARKELEKKAFALLDEAAGEARGLKLVENRARALSIIAGLFWTRDEQAARLLFKEAIEAIVLLTGANDPTDPQHYNNTQTISQLRYEMLQTMAQSDAKMALDFLRATRQPQPYIDPGAEYRPPDQELALELNLASRVAAQDPQTAIRMAEESLSKGVSSNLLGVLTQIAAKDPEAASKLTGDIIRKLRPEGLTRDHEMSSVALQLLGMTRVKDTTPAPASPSVGPSIVGTSSPISETRVLVNQVASGSGIIVDERARRELIETIAAAALSNPSNRSGNTYGLFNALQSVMPEVEKYAPTRVAALRRRQAEAERVTDPRNRVWREYQNIMQQGTIESLLEAAPKAPSQMRDQLYIQAVWKAVSDNNLDRARQIIENISNPQQRAQMLRDIERQLPWKAAEQGNFEAARQMLARLNTIEERVPALIQIANAARTKGDMQTARQLLDEARGLIAGRAQNHAQFYTAIDLASAYAQFDANEAFSVIEMSVGQLNELLDAAAVLNGFGQDAFKDGELKAMGGHMWNDLIRRCASELAVLAPANFERARNIARSFERPDARAMAQLLLAQNLLGGTPAQNGGRRMNDSRFNGRVIRGR